MTQKDKRKVVRFDRVYFRRSPSLRHRAQPWLLVFVQGGRGARRPLPGHAPTEAEPQGVTLQVEHPGTGHRASMAYWRTWRSLPEREEGTRVFVLVNPNGAVRSHKFGFHQSFIETAPAPYGLLQRSSFSIGHLVGLRQEPKLKPRSEPSQRAPKSCTKMALVTVL